MCPSFLPSLLNGDLELQLMNAKWEATAHSAMKLLRKLKKLGVEDRQAELDVAVELSVVFSDNEKLVELVEGMVKTRYAPGNKRDRKQFEQDCGALMG